jgi:hypothetical protein
MCVRLHNLRLSITYIYIYIYICMYIMWCHTSDILRQRILCSCCYYKYRVCLRHSRLLPWGWTIGGRCRSFRFWFRSVKSSGECVMIPIRHRSCCTYNIIIYYTHWDTSFGDQCQNITRLKRNAFRRRSSSLYYRRERLVKRRGHAHDNNNAHWHVIIILWGHYA